MSAGAFSVTLREVSKWYGEVLGVNRVSLDFEPGITAIVAPNGSGKSTLLNLISGLLFPSRGRIEVLGLPAGDGEAILRLLGHCTQHDTLPPFLTGHELASRLLNVRGVPLQRARETAAAALSRAGLGEAQHRRVGAYSKGMRQRLKLVLATAHEPRVLLLDEPLDGLDPLARSQAVAQFREIARAGAIVLVSSHVLHEVDELADRVVLLDQGYVVAEGRITDVRGEIRDRPLQVNVECEHPERVAGQALATGVATGARVNGAIALIETADLGGFSRMLARLAAAEGLAVHSIEPADESVQALFDYLVTPGGGAG